MKLLKKKWLLTVCLVSSVVLLLIVTYLVRGIENKLNSRDVIEEVAKGLELKDTANKINWVVKKEEVDSKEVTYIEGLYVNNLDVPLEGVHTILTLYDTNGEDMCKQVVIQGTILEGTEKLIRFDVPEEYSNFSSFGVELEYNDYTSESLVDKNDIDIDIERE